MNSSKRELFLKSLVVIAVEITTFSARKKVCKILMNDLNNIKKVFSILGELMHKRNLRHDRNHTL